MSKYTNNVIVFFKYLCVIHCVAILQFLIVSQLVKLHTLVHEACQKSYIKALIVIFDILGIEA